jgi:hypothetical protein
MVEIIEYRGYRLEVGRVGKGWRVSIYLPVSTCALPDSPTNLEKSSRDEIVAEAKRINRQPHYVGEIDVPSQERRCETVT